MDATHDHKNLDIPIINEFLESPNPKVLVIKGTWGIGKTHYWKTVVGEHLQKSNSSHYHYVSLFGLKSISQIKFALMLQWNSKVKEAYHSKSWIKSVVSSLETLWNSNKSLVMSGEVIQELYYSICRPQLVCFDDWERYSIPCEEFMGFVNDLKEHKQSKVVVIFNEDKLPNKKVYQEFKEKVVDIEVPYDISNERITSIGLKCSKYADQIRPYIPNQTEDAGTRTSKLSLILVVSEAAILGRILLKKPFILSTKSCLLLK